MIVCLIFFSFQSPLTNQPHLSQTINPLNPHHTPLPLPHTPTQIPLTHPHLSPYTQSQTQSLSNPNPFIRSQMNLHLWGQSPSTSNLSPVLNLFMFNLSPVPSPHMLQLQSQLILQCQVQLMLLPPAHHIPLPLAPHIPHPLALLIPPALHIPHLPACHQPSLPFPMNHSPKNPKKIPMELH